MKRRKEGGETNSFSASSPRSNLLPCPRKNNFLRHRFDCTTGPKAPRHR
jgi:hypothetical protein